MHIYINYYSRHINIYIYIGYHKSEYTPHISEDIEVYLFMGQHGQNNNLT